MKLCNIWPLLNRFPEANDHSISIPENIFNIKVFSRSTWLYFELNLSKFSGFLWKNPCRKLFRINYCGEQKNTKYFSKYSRKKNKNFKAIYAVLDRYFLHWSTIATDIFSNLGLPTILVLLQPWNVFFL